MSTLATPQRNGLRRRDRLRQLLAGVLGLTLGLTGVSLAVAAPANAAPVYESAASDAAAEDTADEASSDTAEPDTTAPEEESSEQTDDPSVDPSEPSKSEDSAEATDPTTKDDDVVEENARKPAAADVPGALAAPLLACNAAANGSFEAPNIQGNPAAIYQDGYALYMTNQLTLNGWEVVDGTIDIMRWWANASDGDQTIDLWGDAPATIQQTFTDLVPGGTYTFSIDYSGNDYPGNPDGVSAATVALDQGSGFVDLATLAPSPTATPGPYPPTGPAIVVNWETYTYQFTASSSSATVRLTNSSTPGPAFTGLFIDNFQFGGLCTDLGDAPDSYGTQLADNGPQHTIVDGLHLGATIDNETDGQPGTAADGDGADEDGVADPIELIAGQSTTVTVSATNNTNEAVTLAGWIDLNGDGTFNNGAERVIVNVPASSGTTDYDLDFPAGTVTADTYARFRLFAGTVAPADVLPTGPASGGEVEDYPVTVVEGPPIFIGCSNLVTFDDGPENWRSVSTSVNDAYTVVNDFGVATWTATGGNPAGAIEANDQDNQMQELWTPPLAANGYATDYSFAIGESLQFDYRNDTGIGFDIYVAVQGANGDRFYFIFRDQITDSTEWTRVTVPMDASQWLTGWKSTIPVGPIGPAPTAADFAAVLANVDHFAFSIEGAIGVDTTLFDNFGQPCDDMGDAPDSYGTTLANHGPTHRAVGLVPGSSVTPLMLGGSIDIEDDGVPTAGADGDDAAASADEDGVADPIVMSSGQPTTVTVSATNDTNEPATLVGWIDLDGDGTFNNGAERVIVNVPANSGTADYDLAFPAGTVTADTYARFRLFPGAVDPADALPTGPAGSGEVEDYPVVVAAQDFGDAPQSYGTLLANDGPRHQVVDGVHLGATIDDEDDGQPGPAADGDGADEDGVTFNPALGYPNPTLLTGLDPNSQQPMDNTLEVDASADGFVSVWVDWNMDGDFDDAGERVANAQPVTAGSNDVTFAQGTNPPGIETYVRVRYSTDAGSIADPVGAAPDGEVEDYRVLVERLVQPDTCVAGDTAYYAFTFTDLVNGTPTGGGVGSNARYPNVTVMGGVAVDMYVEVIAGQMRVVGGGSAPPNGFKIVDADDAGWQIEEDATLRYSFFEAGTTNPIDVSGVFTVNDMDGNSPGAMNETATFSQADLSSYGVNQGSTVQVSTPGASVQFEGTLVGEHEPHQRFQVAVDGIASFDTRWQGGGGSGFGFDGDGDFRLQPPACEDFGDAPDSYGTTLADNGPQHTLTEGLFMGTKIDFDPDGQPTPGADGDDLDRVADEDGVADPIEMTAGQPTTVKVSATNNTNQPATLAGWIDLDGNGTFDAGELQTITVPAGTTAGDFDLMFPAGTVTADTYARFRLFPGTVAPADALPTGPAGGGEVEDYSVTVGAPRLEIEKTSDATVDARPGDTVTYTVTAENTGDRDYTAANPAVVLDDLSGVLDDGVYNGNAQADRGMTPSYASPMISWVGELPVGESVTIEYTVLLATGGDGVVRNVAFGPGCDPADLDCVITTPECDPPTEEGTDPVTGIPCAETELLLPKLTHTKVADTTELPADGGVVTYTITVTNTGPGVFTDTAPGSFSDDLSAVLDDATWDGNASATIGSATFDPAAESITWEGALDVGEVATITYSVTYDSSTGDNRLLNVVCVPVEIAQDPADPCRTVEIPGSDLKDRKTVNPASGTTVVAGQQVTYTLSFENTGLADATVDTFDDVSDVFDDAVLSTGPTSSDTALSAVLNGTQIDIVGTVPAGQTFTVTYTVTVNAYAQQGDHILGNVLGGDECAANDPTCRTTNPIRHITVDKTSDAAADVNIGDTVTYTVTVENDGEADYTAQDPAVADDDLTGVLDDATYNADASTASGAVSYATPILTWTGALAVGDVITFTYTVTVTNAGDHVMENVAAPVCADPEICGPPVTVITPLPHVVPAKSSNPVSGEGVNAGDVVTYTLSWLNDGEATGVVDSTDDLSDILDDGDITTEPVSSDPAVTAVWTGDKIRITGPILKDQTITVTYQVTIKADGDRGNNIARNVLTPDIPPCNDVALCPPPVTEHRIGELDDWKTVDPASGSTVQPGQEVTYTLHFENIGEAAVPVDKDDVLTKVLDDATVTTMPVSSDAALTVSGLNGDRFTITGTLTPGQIVTVTYTVTVNPDGARGDDRLGNFLVDTDEVPPEECVATDDQRPDCTVNHVSNVIPSKSANPKSGSEVSQGQKVTYTLTFENVSTNPDAADAAIDYTDHLADVIDDATLTGAPVTSDPAVTAVVQGDTILVTGTVASGDTITVSYTVTVKAYDQQANHRLGNVIAKTGEEPICVEGSNLCTSHEVPPTPPGLAVTGGSIAWGVVFGALTLLLAGGGVLLISRRRRTAVGTGEDDRTL